VHIDIAKRQLEAYLSCRATAVFILTRRKYSSCFLVIRLRVNADRNPLFAVSNVMSALNLIAHECAQHESTCFSQTTWNCCSSKARFCTCMFVNCRQMKISTDTMQCLIFHCFIHCLDHVCVFCVFCMTFVLLCSSQTLNQDHPMIDMCTKDNEASRVSDRSFFLILHVQFTIVEHVCW
jgi:hypothetical protein